MRFIKNSKDFIEQNDTFSTLFGRTGDVIPKESLHKVKHYAKKIVNNSKNIDSETYYIMTHRGVLFDPMGPYSRRDNVFEDVVMKRVSKNTFDYYITYLKTNNSIYMTKAQRGFLND